MSPSGFSLPSLLNSPQRNPQVHRQQACPYSRLGFALSGIPDTIQPVMFFPIPEHAFDPVPLFLLGLEPRIRLLDLPRFPSQRQERCPDIEPACRLAILTRPRLRSAVS